MRYSIICLIGCLFFTCTLFSQTGSFVLGETEVLNSKVLNENRTLNLYFPTGYLNDTAHYPVIYLLDGSADEDFVHIAGLVQFLNMFELLPPCLVVGIGNVDRRRDFTFPTTNEQDKKDFPTTGGSAAFISFIEQELQPFIQKKYRVNESKILIGQSLGGLLATEILLKKPRLFNKYIIVSPSLWWDDESLLKQAPALLAKTDCKNTHVYVSVGKEGKQMETDARKLVKILKRYVKTDFVYFPGEDHASILHRSVYRAFEILFPKK